MGYTPRLEDLDVEIVRGCKRCGQMPKFSFYSFDYRKALAIVCCTTISGAKRGEAAVDYNEVISRWNAFNNEARAYRKNNKTKTWELLPSEG